MKKKWIALFLASTMLLSLAACNKDDGKKNKKDKDDEDIEEVEDEDDDKKKDDKAEETEAEETTTTEAAPAGTPIDTTYWSGVIPESFEYNDEDFSDSDTWCKHAFYNYDEDGETKLGYVIVYADECDSLEYRKGLKTYMSLEDYAAGNVDTITIGGYDFVIYENTGWGYTVYTYRAESTGIELKIETKGDMPDQQAFLDSLTFDFPDNGKVDAPYPWEGEMDIRTPGTVDMGGASVTATQLVASESFLPDDLFDNRITVVGDTFYALDEQDLKIYTIEGDALTLNTEITLDRAYDQMCSDNNGNVYISSFGAPLLKYNGTELVATYADVKDTVAVSPDGSFAIAYFTSADSLEKINLNDDGTSSVDGSFAFDVTRLKNVSDINIFKNHIFISGTVYKEDGSDDRHKISVFDFNGNLVTILEGEPDGFLDGGMGSVTAIAETDKYIFALDGNMRELLLWSNDGTWLGTVDDDDLLGTDYPWLCGIDVENNTIYLSLVENRPDNSWQEMIFFRVDIK